MAAQALHSAPTFLDGAQHGAAPSLATRGTEGPGGWESNWRLWLKMPCGPVPGPQESLRVTLCYEEEDTKSGPGPG